MEGVRTASWLCALLALAPVGGFAADELQIGIIDFYGLRKLSPQKARQALTFKEGDTVALLEPPAALHESEQRLEALRGVVHAKTNTVCCDDGKAIVYVGIQEKNAPVIQFREAPRGTERLPEDMVQAGEVGACLGIPALTALHAVLMDGGVAGKTVFWLGARAPWVTTPCRWRASWALRAC